ncbi:hypothetical protein Bca4012_005769 [Brassica carinata]|uniref:Uncharacterized protein n=1 Tax=Brassica carinata TaxID=52824 RepID=A0A8X7PZU2_BRACI|nr:hypothetical protein Bca52824_080164 [Brassica carinata]
MSCGGAEEVAESESEVAGFDENGYSIPGTAENYGGEQLCSHGSSEKSIAEQQFHPWLVPSVLDKKQYLHKTCLPS